ncbi:MAG: family transcriptional regulator, aerobic/anaerobic benzoate catabolism transcriptional [Methylobacteriaceae bacterium]|jgi:XRE family aerobic/anaerobic benzoate catabolism transcriptional regulator|nr:family transcriptional regulator, aerobic/anaerobic benzoate catabolism transcriptional [Methylobacteriaceae bacterium]
MDRSDDVQERVWPRTDATDSAASSAGDAEAEFLTALGARVRHLRAMRGMSRKVLSAASGVSERYIAQLESGQGNVSIILLRRVALATGARLGDLIPGADASPDWPVIRDLMRGASTEAIAQVKHLLSGNGGANARATERVALIGLRGAGKSTLGRIVAEKLGWNFVELNKEIERDNDMSVPEIFAMYGQEGYRRFEQAAVRKLIARDGPILLATGGGIVAEPVTFDVILSSFYTIWLKAEPEEHMRRVREQGDLRPMGGDASAMQELRAILVSREPFYARARATVDTAGLSVEEAAARLYALISSELTRDEVALSPAK